MSKKTKNKNSNWINKFRELNNIDLPKLPKIKTEWDLKSLYYKSAKDPQIEADVKEAEEAYKQFAKRWSDGSFLSSVDSLKKALTDYEKLAGNPAISRPGRYFSFRQCLNVNDKEATQKLALLSERLRKASDQILFFSLELGKAPANFQKECLNSTNLKHFHYFLEQLWQSAKHDLSLPEEKIIRLKSRQSSSMWFEAVEKIISNRTVKWKTKDLALPEALETLDLLKQSERKKLWSLILKEMKDIGEIAEAELNAIITDARGEDELRSFEKPYSATTLAYEDTEKSIENLVEAVSAKGFAISRKFYKAKAKYHGVDKLHYTEKYEPIAKESSISFDQAVEICRGVFYGVNEEYGLIFDKMLAKGQIDVFPRKGKRGGAFMSDSTGHPVHVLLNHVDNFKSLETLAHEMGHAIHAHQSAKNSPFYDGHSIITAETASTLFENLVFDAVLSVADDRSKLSLLHDKITRDIATIERQIAFFNCELEMHNTIKEKGSMDNKEFAETMQKHLSSYLGSGVAVEPNDGYSYVYISHLRYGFYVYSYAYGILMSTIMAANYKADKSYSEKIDKFLTAGSSDNVANIFASIGIDTTKKDTFEKALDNQANDVALFIKLAKKSR